MLRKKVKKSLAGILLSGVIITSGFGNNVQAAGNIKDIKNTYNFTNNSSAYTTAEPKYDSTSAYMKLLTITDGDCYYNATVVNSSNGNFSKTFPSVWFGDSGAPGQYPIDFGGKYIKNWAYEDKGYGVKVKIKAAGRRGPTAPEKWRSTNVWSPDSI